MSTVLMAHKLVSHVQFGSPAQVGSATDWQYLGGGSKQCFALRDGGKLFTWGEAENGALGSGATTDRSSPVQVGSLTDWGGSACKAGGQNRGGFVKDDYTLWTWGNNIYGSLGDGTTTDRSSPVQIGSLTDWSTLACGYRSMNAIKTDGVDTVQGMMAEGWEIRLDHIGCTEKPNI